MYWGLKVLLQWAQKCFETFSKQTQEQIYPYKVKQLPASTRWNTCWTPHFQTRIVILKKSFTTFLHLFPEARKESSRPWRPTTGCCYIEWQPTLAWTTTWTPVESPWWSTKPPTLECKPVFGLYLLTSLLALFEYYQTNGRTWGQVH